MKKGNKALIIIATLIGVAGLGYLSYWLYTTSQKNSGNPEKDNRQIIQNLVK
jgi:uncharacterized membrane protein YebE (DUF533 family)